MQDEVILCPIGENRPISTVCDELLGELSHLWVQIVHDVVDDASCLWCFGGVVMVRIGHHAIGGSEAIHVDVAVILQLSVKLSR